MIDSSLHSEGRRQAYLAALGIPLWTVRQELTYAAPSTQTQFVAYEDAFFADVTVVEVEPLLEEMPSSQNQHHRVNHPLYRHRPFMMTNRRLMPI